MTRSHPALLGLAGLISILMTALPCMAADTGKEQDRGLENRFSNPPDSAKASCYWWWFNDLVNREGITRDLEEFKNKGLGSVLLICSGNGYGVDPMPSGPKFLSPEWFGLYRHTLDTAERLNLEVGVNLCPGWCMGGPWITPEYACRWFLQSQMTVRGPGKFSGTLPLPGPRDGYDSKPCGTVGKYIDRPLDQDDYRDTAVVAFREPSGGVDRLSGDRADLLPAKSNRLDANCFISAHSVMEPTLRPWTNGTGDHPVSVSDVVDLTGRLKPDGSLDWDIPPGNWTIVRTGHRMTGMPVKMQMPDFPGLAVDWFSPAATDLHFDHLGEALVREAGRHAGKTLKVFHTDSFEDGYPNWTPEILNRFREYRHYDPVPYLPVFSGHIIGSAEISDRFLHDYRKTVAQCMAEGNYGRLAERTHGRGLLLQCEAAGPSWSGTVCLDALLNLGKCDRPMGEFWQDQTFVEEGQNKVCKQTATAAHVYGHPTASAEAFTSFLPHWGDSPASLKPKADRAFCEGINRLVFHCSTATRPGDGLPGYEYGAGTHFNPNVTWWNQAAGSLINYINRCQTLLQEGRFVADVLYYNGDGAPNLVGPKHIDPSLGPGYDYDVCNADVLLNRFSVKDGRLILPDGMSYRVLVLPTDKRMPVEVIEKLKSLVAQGATVIGPKPVSDPGLRNYPDSDRTVRRVADEMWGEPDAQGCHDHRFGQGRVIHGRTIREVLTEEGVTPDFESSGEEGKEIDFIHRRTDSGEIYFLVNRSDRPLRVDCTFRVAGRQPELWNPIDGKLRDLRRFRQNSGRTIVPLEFDPFGSMFVIFRRPPEAAGGEGINFPSYREYQRIEGPWKVSFDPKWGGPAEPVTFQSLEDWSKRPEDGIRYYSGTAVYRKRFEFPVRDCGDRRLFLDLGTVRESARVRLNGRDLGVLWNDPRRVEITDAVREGANELEIEVVNLWPNRLIGDGKLPPDRRLTRTNVTKYSKEENKLLESGLLGPVTILATDCSGSVTNREKKPSSADIMK